MTNFEGFPPGLFEFGIIGYSILKSQPKVSLFVMTPCS